MAGSDSSFIYSSIQVWFKYDVVTKKIVYLRAISNKYDIYLSLLVKSKAKLSHKNLVL